MGAEIQVQRTGLPARASTVDLQKAYTEAVLGAQYEHGHGGYTGTIAEANGLEIRPDLVFATEREAYEWAQEHAVKWGPAVALQVAGEWWFVGCYSS